MRHCPPFAPHMLHLKTGNRTPPCSPHVCALIARLARPALLCSCDAHAVCVCRVQACDVGQAHVQSSGFNQLHATGEGG